MKKRGFFGLSWIAYLIIGILVLVIAVTVDLTLRQKGISALEWIRDLWRYGG